MSKFSEFFRRCGPQGSILIDMRIPVAIVIAGALVAVAILIAFRWQISGATGFVYRLDRWTGHTTVCNVDSTTCLRVEFDR
jgi:hypothetical protein